MKREWSAVILAGGIGSRLDPLTRTRPKPLVPVANHPMIDYNIQILKNANIKRIVVIVKYLGDQIRNWIQNKYPELDIIVPNIEPLDTADAVRKSGKFIDGPFLCTMADIITNISLSSLIEFHDSKPAIASISLKHVDQPKHFGVIMLNSEERILLFMEKPNPQDLYLTTLAFATKQTVHLQSNLVNTGMYAFEPEVLDLLVDEADLMDFGKHVFPFLARKKLGIFGYVADYYWLDCGTPEKYLWGNYDVTREWSWPYLPAGIQSNTGFWGENIQWQGDSTVLGPVVVGHNVVIGNGVEILPLTIIGNNCIIENGVRLEKCVIWDRCRIGRGADIKACIICDEVEIGEGSTLKEMSIIGKGAKISPGTVVEKGCIVQPQEIYP